MTNEFNPNKYPPPRGIDQRIMLKVEKRIDHCLSIRSKTFVVFFVLKYPVMEKCDSDNKAIQVFMDRFTKNLEAKHLDPHYVWAREQNTSQNHHYHCIFMLNGKLTQNKYGHMEVAKKIWMEILKTTNTGLVHYDSDERMLCVKSDSFQEDIEYCLNQGRYVAKTLGKDKAPPKIRSFGYSHLSAGVRRS